eukprot:NODE_751_length_4217_cov_0.448762.p1 type:complete len:365 gc:universal NODE_751_length_4217_cov_0.448762:366-1460(+)
MLFTVGIFGSQCSNTDRVRKEVRDMTPEDWADYKQALRAMQTDGSYQKQAQIHVDIFGKVHGNYVFAQWHRIYLCQFEDEVRKHANNKALSIPYYAAWEDSYKYGATNLDQSPVFSEQYYGAGKGDGSCVTSSAQTIFESASTNVGGNHCVQRKYDHSRAVSGRDAVTQLYKNSNDFKQFSDLLQVGYHAEQHLFINGDMGQHYSANDPIFFAHHASVDYLYDEYQDAHNDYDPNSIPENSQQAAIFSQYTYGDAHANKVCCVTYVPYGGGNAPAPTNETAQVVVNKKASDADMAKLGISPEQAAKQDQWNSFKESVANNSNIPFIKDLLNGNNTAGVKPKTGSSSVSMVSSSMIGVFILSFFF